MDRVSLLGLHSHIDGVVVARRVHLHCLFCVHAAHGRLDMLSAPRTIQDDANLTAHFLFLGKGDLGLGLRDLR